MIKVKSKQSPIVKIGTNEKELKYVLQLESAGTASSKEIINFCQKHTHTPRVFLKATVEAVIQAIVHYTMLGYRVELEDLGTFRLTVKSKAVDKNTEAGLSQLEEISLKFTPKKELTEQIRQADVELSGVFKIVDLEKKIYEEVGTKELDGDDQKPSQEGGNNNQGGDDLVG